MLEVEKVFSRLVPQVQLIEMLSGSFDFSVGGCWSCDGTSVCRQRIEELFRGRRDLWTRKPGVGRVCFELSENYSAESYELLIEKESIVVRGGDDAALCYGALTLLQLVDLCDDSVPCALIKDAPALSVRGVMLDVSRDKVPTMQTLFDLIDKLSRLKFNHVQLYMEHTFAYKEHEIVWRDASPFTEDEVQQLDEFCRERFIELVPNQNSFGHMERWLVHPEYNHLAALPEGGAPLPWGGVKPFPTALNPLDSQCLDFLDKLYSELLPCFSSELFNIGGDEVFELSVGRCANEVEKSGEGRVYLDFLKKIFVLVRKYGCRPAFWGDIIVKYPELVSELPTDAVALEWGYEADHPFEQNSRLFQNAGLDFYVCPGTSSWNSIAGRFGNMCDNIASASRSAVKFGAKGLVVADWGDAGHWQPLSVSYAGFVYSAAAAWKPDCVEEIDVPAAISRFFIGDDSAELARMLVDLAELYETAGALCANSSVLFNLVFKKEYCLPDGVTVDSLDAVQRVLDSVSERLKKLSTYLSGELSFISQEIDQMVRLLSQAVFRGRALLGGDDEKKEFRLRWDASMKECVAEQRNVWMLRNREGGLADSLGRAILIYSE